MKKATTTAEFVIRKYLEKQPINLDCFVLEMTGPHEAELRDGNGDGFKLIFEPDTKNVIMI